MVRTQTKKTAKKKGEESELDREECEVSIVNIVVSSSLERDVSLEKMATNLHNTEYNPEQFPGLVHRIDDPETSALIFNSGKIVLTGAKNMEDVRKSLNRIIEDLESIDIEVEVEPEINVQNIVASGSINISLNLNTLAIRLPNIEYEPEQFPGLVYKPVGTEATFLLFTNGEIVCTGTKTEDDVYKAVDTLVENLGDVV